MRGIVTDFKRFAVHDGDGIRTTVFLQGCPLSCIWCHNPECIPREINLLFYHEKCTSCGECVKACAQGVHEITAEGKHILHREKCIRCGACTNVCPFGLAPADILLAYKKKDLDRLQDLNVNSCMLCGSCAFNCPANRPLVQTNALSKQMLKEKRMKEKSHNG